MEEKESNFENLSLREVKNNVDDLQSELNRVIARYIDEIKLENIIVDIVQVSSEHGTSYPHIEVSTSIKKR